MKHSDSIVNISKALVEAQKELKNPKQTADNPFYHSSYAPLNEVLDEIRPIYNKHEIAILQDIQESSEKISISTIFLHSSGEWIQQEGMPLPMEKNTPQAAGSTVTYGRRYSVLAWSGLASEEDDDGNTLEKTKDTIKEAFHGEEIEQFKIGQEIPKAFWNYPIEQQNMFIPEGAKKAKVDGIWRIVKK